MPHPRALTEQAAIDLEAWYCDFERVGTIDAKARELGISRQTLYDAVRRRRGLDTTPMRRKLTQFELGQLVGEVLARCHVEPRQTVKQQSDDSERE